MPLTKKGAATKAKAAARKASGTPTYTGTSTTTTSKKEATLEYMGPSLSPTRYYTPPHEMKIERARDISVSSSFTPTIATRKVSFPGGLTAKGEATKAKVEERQTRGFQGYLGRDETISYAATEAPMKKQATVAEAKAEATPRISTPGTILPTGGVGTAIGGFSQGLGEMLGGAGGEEGEGIGKYLPIAAIVGIIALASGAALKKRKTRTAK